VIQAMELLSWTRELLTGFSIITGPGKPFLDVRLEHSAVKLMHIHRGGSSLRIPEG
jgi:hypothetical protein